ncbi:hypothetical protein A5712_15510 [Mycobacterium sp. E2327]|nr:hypothetical protein A5712_15510 [Mycobacterium sp. E2327]
MAFSGAAFVLLLFPTIIMTGLLPSISPMRNANEIAEFPLGDRFRFASAVPRYTDIFVRP